MMDAQHLGRLLGHGGADAGGVEFPSSVSVAGGAGLEVACWSL